MEISGLQPGDEIVSVRTVRTRRASSQPNAGAKPGLLRSLVVLVVGAVVIYALLPRGAKDDVNTIASHSGIVGHVVPWTERADTALRTMLAGDNGAVAAQTIQGLVHPTGQAPRLLGYDIVRLGDRMLARLSVAWQSGLFRSGDGTGAFDHIINVEWEFNETGHIHAQVTLDDAPGAGDLVPRAGELLAQALDEWFRDQLYPALQTYAG